MAQDVRVDDRGRMTIPMAVLDRSGAGYRLVELDGVIKLVPRPADPVATLRDASTEELGDASIETLQVAATEAARDQAGEHDG